MIGQKKFVIFNILIGALILVLLAYNIPNFHFKTNTIRGKIIGPDGPVVNASVWLSKLSDTDCAVMNDRVLSTPDLLLTESEYQQIRDCMSPFATTTTDTEGRYIIEKVPDGWYHISFQWQQNQPPSMTLDNVPTETDYYSKIIGREWRNTQLLEVKIMEDAPGIYFIAVGNPAINFSADTELVMDFTW